MSIPLKYGSILALGVICWVSLSNFVFHMDPQSSAGLNSTLIIFNLLPILCIYLGIRERRARNGGELILGEGVVTGLGIIFVYVVIACAFFAVMGNRLLAQQGAGATQMPLWQHFAGFVFAAMLGGLILSTVISFVMKRARVKTP
jgi:heme/copper-type cytochrome/quinol oxidase subunit 4